MAKVLLTGLYIKKKETDRIRKHQLVVCDECGCVSAYARSTDVEKALKAPCTNCADSSREKRELAYELIDQIRSNRKKQAEAAE
jgi:hypothetical protein